MINGVYRGISNFFYTFSKHRLWDFYDTLEGDNPDIEGFAAFITGVIQERVFVFSLEDEYK